MSNYFDIQGTASSYILFQNVLINLKKSIYQRAVDGSVGIIITFLKNKTLSAVSKAVIRSTQEQQPSRKNIFVFL